MADLSTLLRPLTATQVRSTTLGLLAAARFPVTSWQVGSVPLTLINAWSRVVADLSLTVQKIAAGGYLELAEGDWLDLLAESHYGVSRRQSAATIGTVSLTSVAGAGPYTWQPGQLVVGDDTGNLYSNVASFTLSAGTTTSISVRAQVAGTRANAGNSTIRTLVAGGQAGVTINNPPLGTGTWITSPGVDPERDAELKDRCRARWSTLAAGATVQTMQYWALSSGASTITRARVVEGESGVVDVILGGPTGAPSDADMLTASIALRAKRPVCVVLFIRAARTRNLTIGGTVQVRTAFLDGAATDARAAINAYVQTVPVGGRVEINRLVAAVMQAGVVSAELRDGNGNVLQQGGSIQLGTEEVAAWTDAIQWVSV